MRTVNTPPRRKSVISKFKTPVRRRVSDKQSKESNATPKFDIDDSQDDDGYTLSAKGDISLSRPYYIPGAPGALSPQGSQRGTPDSEGIRRRPLRARPPVRRLLYSVDSESYKFSSLAEKMGSLSSVASSKREQSEIVPPSVVLSSASRTSTIATIPDEEDVSTPQSRFMAFMASRDLTHSPKKSDAAPVHPLDELIQDAEDALEREAARPTSRPLRGNARLPPRPPLPEWDSMDVDVDSSF